MCNFSFIRKSLPALLCAALLSVALPGPPACAELPPDVYQKLQAAAPEVLDIEITRVTRRVPRQEKGPHRLIDIAATAIVRRVGRSATGVKTGAVIRLYYQTYEVVTPGWVGPGPITQVLRGAHYRAWLRKTGKIFQPAAKGQSFQQLAWPKMAALPARKAAPKRAPAKH
jgi:hypothetical protein